MRANTATILIAFLSVGITHMAEAIEEPSYQTLKRFEAVEIRHYQPVIQAVTRLPADAREGRGFRRLAGFIFGGNNTGQSIAMTAPVQETLADSGLEMAFTMPSQYQMDDLPRPDDPTVELQAVDERTVAVIQFSGWATDSKVEKYRARLEQQLSSRSIPLAGPWLLNQYNPPWTLPFMRRNEIWIEVDWPGERTASR